MIKTTSTATSGLQSCKKVEGGNIFLLTEKMPRHPKLPTAELVVKNYSEPKKGGFYAWKCDGYGICIYSENRKSAPLEWLDAYLFEYFYEVWTAIHATQRNPLKGV